MTLMKIGEFNVCYLNTNLIVNFRSPKCKEIAKQSADGEKSINIIDKLSQSWYVYYLTLFLNKYMR